MECAYPKCDCAIFPDGAVYIGGVMVGVIDPEIMVLRDENTRLREALEKAMGAAKVFWLDYPLSNLADADALCGICEGIASAIKELQKDALFPQVPATVTFPPPSDLSSVTCTVRDGVIVAVSVP